LGDEDELALLLQDIVEPLQHPLSVLQKVRRYALASLSLVTSEEGGLKVHIYTPFSTAFLVRAVDLVRRAHSLRRIIPTLSRNMQYPIRTSGKSGITGGCPMSSEKYTRYTVVSSWSL